MLGKSTDGRLLKLDIRDRYSPGHVPQTTCPMDSKVGSGILHWLRGMDKSRIYLGIFFAAFLLTGWIWRPSIPLTLYSDRHVVDSGIKLSESVCWRGIPLLGHDGAGVIEILGGGCGECLVGRICHFQLHFHNPIPFKLIGHNTSHPDLMITITGPTVFHAIAREVAGETWDSGIRFEATYTSWDAGDYTALAESGCAMEVNSMRPEAPHYQSLATWALKVKENPSLFPSNSPCQRGHLARWVPNNAPEEVAAPAPALDPSLPPRPLNDLDLARRSDWKLGYYDCAAAAREGAEFEHVPGALLDLGINEISFIGDSHMRALVLSMVYGIMVVQDPGYEVDQSKHGNRFFDLPVTNTPKTLKINFYWLAGLYEEEKPYGCTRWGQGTGWPPSYSNSSDVVVMDGGTWENDGCDNPRTALARSLPRFLETIMAIEHKPETMFVWRSEPPYPLPFMSCEAKALRSTDLVWANDLFREVVETFGVHFFDFWALEAPRYTETCLYYDGNGAVLHDHHFLCMRNGWKKVWGAVGMDTTKHFLELIRRTAQSERAKAGK